MEISKLLTDDAILAEIGARVTRYRIHLQLTQADLADRAGVSKRTVERIEAGTSAQMSSMIRVLRALDLVADRGSHVPRRRSTSHRPASPQREGAATRVLSPSSRAIGRALVLG